MPFNGAVAPTTIEVRISRTAPIGTFSGRIGDSSPGATNQIINVGGTVIPSQASAISVSVGSLGLGSTTAGTPGSQQSYTVSGVNLSGPITISAPAGVGISNDGGNTFLQSLTLFPTGNAVLPTTIKVRISRAAAPGPIAGAISNSSPGAAGQPITVSGTVNAPSAASLTVSTSSLDLGSTSQGTPGPTHSYTISGGKLSGPITITAPGGVGLSADGGNTYVTSLTLTPVAGEVATTTIDVRIARGAAIGTLGGLIQNTSPGATEQDISITGAVHDAQSPSISVTTGFLNLGSATAGTPGSTHSFTLSGSDLAGPITISAPAGVGISGDGGNTFVNSLTFNPTSGSVPSTTIDVRISRAASVGNVSGVINLASPNAVTRTVTVTGTVNALAPGITVNASSLNLGTTKAGTPGAVRTFIVSGSQVSGPITITAPAGLGISDDGGATFSTVLTLHRTNNMIPATSVQVRISRAAAVGGIGGVITLSDPGATSKTIAVTGNVIAAQLPSISISLSSASLGTTTKGTPGATHSYIISGANLLGSITILAPAGVGISDDGGVTFVTSLTLTPFNGKVATTTILVRISRAAQVGAITGVVRDISPGAAEQDVVVSGTVKP
jgi:hypothetical protein